MAGVTVITFYRGSQDLLLAFSGHIFTSFTQITFFLFSILDGGLDLIYGGAGAREAQLYVAPPAIYVYGSANS